MKGNIGITISRIHSSHVEDDFISIEMEDKISHVRFLKLKMALADFSKAITGLSSQEATAEFSHLEHIGKQKIREERETLCPIVSHDKIYLEKWLEKNRQEEGWILNPYLGLRGAIAYPLRKEGTILRYSVYKYIDV